MLSDKINRSHFKHYPFYLAALLFIGCLIPHSYWLYKNDFITINYAFNRVDTLPDWTNHISFAYEFAWQQLLTFLPAAILGFSLFLGKKSGAQDNTFSLDIFDKRFLFYLGIAPFLLTLLLSVIFAMHLRAGWGQPLISLWGIILFAWLKPTFSSKRITTFLICFACFLMLIVSLYAVSLIKAKSPSSANFPAEEIATQLNNQWQKQFSKPVKYIIGSRWLSGSLAFNIKPHPAVYIAWNKQFSPWINESELATAGAIFVWQLNYTDEKLTDEVARKLPDTIKTTILYFDWKRNKKMEPIKIMVAFIPPKFLSKHP